MHMRYFSRFISHTCNYSSLFTTLNRDVRRYLHQNELQQFDDGLNLIYYCKAHILL